MATAQTEDSLFAISKEFIDENKKLQARQFHKNRRGGPYTKKERKKRRLEVFRLHVDFGYSAVKIAELMKINRNTINQDIKWCYQQIKEQFSVTPGEILDKQLCRHESQRARLVNMMQETEDPQTKISIEKLILELDSKIASIMLKIDEYRKQANLASMKAINEYLDKNHKNDDFPRFVLKQQFEEVTAETRKKIDELITKGKKWHSCKVKKQ